MKIPAAEEITHEKKAEVWGRAYEVLVKSGVLSCLVDKELVDLKSEHLSPWGETTLTHVFRQVVRSLNLVDPTQISSTKRFFSHMAVCATGHGYTAMREFLKANGNTPKVSPLKVAHIWCPLQLPSLSKEIWVDRDFEFDSFCKAFDIDPMREHGLKAKGGGANADLAISFSREQGPDLLLVLEFSYSLPALGGDMREEDAYLSELIRFLRKRQSKGVYSRLSAEVDAESFSLSADIKNHLIAFSSKDKPLYKLCQASAYIESIVKSKNLSSESSKQTIVRAMAVTPEGVESIGCEVGPAGQDSSLSLLLELASAYRNSQKLQDGNALQLNERIEQVFNSVLNKLPREMKRALRGFKTPPLPGQNYSIVFSEIITDFTNPADTFTVEEILNLVEPTKSLDDAFGSNFKSALGKALAEKSTNGLVSLRDAHAAAVMSALRQSKQGEIRLLSMVGNPGIGKTTAVKNHLIQAGEGFLFIYISPRTVINKDVSESLSRNSKGKSGTLTLTTNSLINAASSAFFEKRIKPNLSIDDTTRDRNIDAAVVVDGIENLIVPTAGSVLILTPEQEEELDRYVSGQRTRKLTQSEHNDYVVDSISPGVIATVASSAKTLIDLNPQIDRVAITVATQGYKNLARGKSTIDSFSKIFKSPASTPHGAQERRSFATRFPNIIVMVDEVAGDGAGPQFVHQMTKWLDDEFIEPFEQGSSPFNVTMIAADASLGNELVFGKYLQAGPTSPPKIFISKSDQGKPFNVAASRVRIGGALRNAVFVMANSFPATNLDITYQINLSRVQAEQKSNGQMETAREAIRRVAGQAPLNHAVREIQTALGREARQVIYFAQDKLLLGELRAHMTSGEHAFLGLEDVQIIDNSVPAWKRKKLLEPSTRDQTKVFLMTSSGARGISFPLADWIIAAVPRFSVEASLMEICTQLIYRGRGFYENSEGKQVSGDKVRRHIRLLINDYVFNEEDDHRQWLRQSTDLMTMVVLLRGAIFTRITGNAGLRQPFALAPVGLTGVAEQSALMSESVSAFLREANIFSARGASKDLIGLAVEAARLVADLFQNTHLQRQQSVSNQSKSLVSEHFLAKSTSKLSSPFRRLVEAFGAEPLIGEECYFFGPLILEKWSDGTKEESFKFIEESKVGKSNSGALLAMLSAIDQCDDYPSLMRNPAKELYGFLVREKEMLQAQFSARKKVVGGSTWVAIPAGATRFINDEDTALGQKYEVREPEAWLSALAASFGSGGGIIPAIAVYKSFPWAAKLGGEDPCGFEQIFDNRYFMLSSELNLLNTLLLEESRLDSPL